MEAKEVKDLHGNEIRVGDVVKHLEDTYPREVRAMRHGNSVDVTVPGSAVNTLWLGMYVQIIKRGALPFDSAAEAAKEATFQRITKRLGEDVKVISERLGLDMSLAASPPTFRYADGQEVRAGDEFRNRGAIKSLWVKSVADGVIVTDMITSGYKWGEIHHATLMSRIEDQRWIGGYEFNTSRPLAYVCNEKYSFNSPRPEMTETATSAAHAIDRFARAVSRRGRFDTLPDMRARYTAPNGEVIVFPTGPVVGARDPRCAPNPLPYAEFHEIVTRVCREEAPRCQVVTDQNDGSFWAFLDLCGIKDRYGAFKSQRRIEERFRETVVDMVKRLGERESGKP